MFDLMAIVAPEDYSHHVETAWGSIQASLMQPGFGGVSNVPLFLLADGLLGRSEARTAPRLDLHKHQFSTVFIGLRRFKTHEIDLGMFESIIAIHHAKASRLEVFGGYILAVPARTYMICSHCDA